MTAGRKTLSIEVYTFCTLGFTEKFDLGNGKFNTITRSMMPDYQTPMHPNMGEIKTSISVTIEHYPRYISEVQ